MLNDQVISVPFAGGLDTKSDAKTVVAGDLTALENGVFTAANAIQKRNGYDALPTAVTSGAPSIGASDALAVYKPSPAVEERLQFGGNKVYSYSSALSKWVDKGACYSLGESVRPISRSYRLQQYPDSAINGNIEVHAWIENANAVATVLDRATGVRYLDSYTLAVAGEGVRVISIGSSVYVFYLGTAGNLNYRKLDASTPGTFAAEVTLLGGVAISAASIDFVTDGTNIWLAYSTGTAINVKKLDSSAAIVASGSIAEIPTGALAIVVSTNVFVYWFNSVNGTRYAVLNSSLGSVLAATTIDATTAPVTNAITAYPLSSTSQVVFYEVNASATYNVYTKKATVSSAAVTGAAAVLLRSVGIAAKAFSVNSEVFYIAAHQSTLQSTFFCVKSDGKVVARIMQTVAGGLRSSIAGGVPNYLAAVNTINSTSVSFSASVISKIVQFTGAYVAKLSVNAVNLDFAAANQYISGMLGKNLHIAGAQPSIYDGIGAVEQGFNLFPENVTALQGAAGGTALADGNYQYCVVYEWVDAQGQVHRSAPSTPTLIAVTGGGGNAKVTLTIPTLRLTDKARTSNSVAIQIYRTAANGSVFYNVLADLIPTVFNDATVDTVTYQDTTQNTALLSHELLYTNGGVLENIAAPAHSLIDVYQSRAVIAGLDDPLQFWFSKTWQPQEGVAFNDSLTLRCDPFGGDIKAVKLMDDKVVLFKERAIFFISGDGPNDAGQGSTYGSPQLISSDVGCPYPKSVVLTPMGIMFMSYKGIYLLDRSLSVSYIGAKVEAYNSQNITAATLHNSKNQVRFLTDSGSALVYDYLFSKWSTFTNHTGVGAIIADSGKYHYLRSDGTVYEESTSFQDAGTSQYLKAVTAWLKLSGLQGFQRVRAFGILASYKSAHTLRVRVYYDYDDVNYDEYNFDAATVIASTSVPYQFRSPHLKRQKCEAIKFEIQDTSSTGEAYSLADLTLEAGMKKGINRLKASQTV